MTTLGYWAAAFEWGDAVEAARCFERNSASAQTGRGCGPQLWRHGALSLRHMEEVLQAGWRLWLPVPSFEM